MEALIRMEHFNFNDNQYDITVTGDEKGYWVKVYVADKPVSKIRYHVLRDLKFNLDMERGIDGIEEVISKVKDDIQYDQLTSVVNL